MADQNAASGTAPATIDDNSLQYFSDHFNFTASESFDRFKSEEILHKRNIRSAKSGHALVAEVQRLQAENQRLNDQLGEANDKIFSLQPYIEDLTPNQVSRAFDDLAANIEHWVYKFMEPWSESSETGISLSLSAAHERQSCVEKLSKAIHEQPDLLKACTFPDTDIDICVALIWRFLKFQIWDQLPTSVFGNVASSIEFLQTSFDQDVKPRRTTLFVHNWKAEAYNALLCRQETQDAQEALAEALARAICGILGVFAQNGEEGQFERDCLESCVLPAIALRNKMLVSKDNVNLGVRTFCSAQEAGKLQTDLEFLSYVNLMVCEDILHERKKLEPGAMEIMRAGNLNSREDVRAEVELEPVLAVRPALIMQRLDRQNSVEPEEKVIRKQSMVVALGTRRERLYACRKRENCIEKILYDFC